MTNTLRRMLPSVVAGLLALAVPALGAAQPAADGAPAVRRERHRAATPAQASGTVARYVVGPRGHVRGFSLADGRLVMVRGGDAMAARVPAGSSVRVEGFARAGDPSRIGRATVYGPDGAVVASPPERGERGMRRGHHPRGERGARGERRAQLPALSASGPVQTVLAGRRGHARAALLRDGTLVVLRPRLARAIADRGGLRAGEVLRVEGRGQRTAHGAGVVAERVTFADGATVALPGR